MESRKEVLNGQHLPIACTAGYKAKLFSMFIYGLREPALPPALAIFGNTRTSSCQLSAGRPLTPPKKATEQVKQPGEFPGRLASATAQNAGAQCSQEPGLPRRSKTGRQSVPAQPSP